MKKIDAESLAAEWLSGMLDQANLESQEAFRKWLRTRAGSGSECSAVNEAWLELIESESEGTLLH
jgi:hypothetical protein